MGDAPTRPAELLELELAGAMSRRNRSEGRRRRRTSQRSRGTNARAVAANPRALGTNPRALGTNPRPSKSEAAGQWKQRIRRRELLAAAGRLDGAELVGSVIRVRPSSSSSS